MHFLFSKDSVVVLPFNFINRVCVLDSFSAQLVAKCLVLCLRLIQSGYFVTKSREHIMVTGVCIVLAAVKRPSCSDSLQQFLIVHHYNSDTFVSVYSVDLLSNL